MVYSIQNNVAYINGNKGIYDGKINDNSVRYGFATKEFFYKPFVSAKAEWFIFYLCSCLSTQFLYRTAIKATFNVKDNIKDIIKNSITLTINITTLPTKIRKIGGKNHICLFSFPMSVSITYILQ